MPRRARGPGAFLTIGSSTTRWKGALGPLKGKTRLLGHELREMVVYQ